MSQSGWYHDKAAECNRMALASANAVTRGRHIKDRDNWREIAARIDAAEEAVKKEKKITKAASVGGLFQFRAGIQTSGDAFQKNMWRLAARQIEIGHRFRTNDHGRTSRRPVE